MAAPLREQQEYHYIGASHAGEENIVAVITQDRVIARWQFQKAN